MAENDNCCNCAYLTPPWWVTMGFIPPTNGVNVSQAPGGQASSGFGGTHSTPPSTTPPSTTPPSGNNTDNGSGTGDNSSNSDPIGSIIKTGENILGGIGGEVGKGLSTVADALGSLFGG